MKKVLNLWRDSRLRVGFFFSFLSSLQLKSCPHMKEREERSRAGDYLISHLPLEEEQGSYRLSALSLVQNLIGSIAANGQGALSSYPSHSSSFYSSIFTCVFRRDVSLRYENTQVIVTLKSNHPKKNNEQKTLKSSYIRGLHAITHYY